MPKKIIAIFTLSAVILSAAACGRPSEISESTTAGETTLSSESLPASEPESAPVTLLPEEMTEEQLRSALSALGTSDDDNLQKPVFYRELRARDALSEADYTDWAEISGQLGDQTTQREILFELYYLYPTVLHAQLATHFPVLGSKKPLQHNDAELAALPFATQFIQVPLMQYGVLLS